MLMGYLIDGLCRIILSVFAVIVVAFVIVCIVFAVGEKMKWWK